MNIFLENMLKVPRHDKHGTIFEDSLEIQVFFGIKWRKNVFSFSIFAWWILRAHCCLDYLPSERRALVKNNKTRIDYWFLNQRHALLFCISIQKLRVSIVCRYKLWRGTVTTGNCLVDIIWGWSMGHNQYWNSIALHCANGIWRFGCWNCKTPHQKIRRSQTFRWKWKENTEHEAPKWASSWHRNTCDILLLWTLRSLKKISADLLYAILNTL